MIDFKIQSFYGARTDRCKAFESRFRFQIILIQKKKNGMDESLIL